MSASGNNIKISIIGAGNVGGLTAMRIAEAGFADVVLVDVVKNLAQAKAEDIKDAISIKRDGSHIYGTNDISSIKGSSIIIVTAGVARMPGMDREDLLKINSHIIKEISQSIKMYALRAIVIVVSNPVDVMTYLMLKETGFKKRKVFGMGSSLDSGRFATLITKKLNLKPGSIKAQVIGSHSNTMLPLIRSVKVKNRKLSNLLSEQDVDKIVCATQNRGGEIVGLFGRDSAYFAPSAALFNIAKAIIKNKNTIIPVSCLLDGEYDVKNVCIGVLSEINRNGIKKIIKIHLTKEEKQDFLDSANKVKQGIDRCMMFV